MKTRVKEGGHNIPVNVIRRRFVNGLKNLFKMYIPIVDNWILVDNSTNKFEYIALGDSENVKIENDIVWNELIELYGN